MPYSRLLTKPLPTIPAEIQIALQSPHSITKLPYGEKISC